MAAAAETAEAPSAQPPVLPRALTETVIVPSKGWVSLRLADVWRFRELMYFLIWRDVKVRYKQTILGVAWAVIQPLFTMLIFTIFFHRLGRMPSDQTPYPVFAFCGLLPWQLFAHAMTESGNSLIANERLLTKVYFPRLIIPFAAVLAGLVDFGIAFLILLGMMVFFHIVPALAILWLPFFILMTIATALAAGLWLSSLNVQYRDVRYTIPFLTQCWLFLTPVVYPSSLVPGFWRTIYSLNPMVGVVEGFRWVLLGAARPPVSMMAASGFIVVAGLFSGLFYFRRMERRFADIV